MNLANTSPHRKDLCDAGNALNAPPDGPVCKGAQVLAIHLLSGAVEAYQHDFTHQGRNGCHVGENAFGELWDGCLQAFLNKLTRSNQISTPVKFYIDERQGHIGGSPQAGHSRHAHQGTLQRNADTTFHLLRSQTRGFGQNGDRRLGQVRKYFDGQFSSQMNASCQKHQCRHHDDGAMLQ